VGKLTCQAEEELPEGVEELIGDLMSGLGDKVRPLICQQSREMTLTFRTRLSATPPPSTSQGSPTNSPQTFKGRSSRRLSPCLRAQRMSQWSKVNSVPLWIPVEAMQAVRWDSEAQSRSVVKLDGMACVSPWQS
jgi:hypothetical protein